ncbi:MipA/OmpV family protein [Scleromatobacter humisilvae]|uniref:MipA/OmpV family protein n=1 Tax=Scleromatobacter humisilvae TaxID=2897159 RepID=A0A9X2C0T8_9BURK|nr:MipA/OmpV family protein [Scleromatobacter humisilvae]MCK9688173.1 MipA/OmpV family protein [Scleromatobacter humisilvae]
MRFRAAPVALALLVAAASVRAQSTMMMMPEGSKDLYVGVVLADVAASEGSSARRLVAVPTASGLWSNGVFARIGAVGWDATDDPTMDYGPIVTYGIRSKRSDDAGHESSLDIEGGGFWNFMFTREVQFGSQLLYGGGADGQGLQLRLGADVSYRLGSHDSLTLSPGVTLADGSFMRSTYGITAAQAKLDGVPAYDAKAGVRNVHLDIDWNSELSTKFTLDTGVSLSRLAGSAAHSPLIARRDDATLFLALTYHL